MMRILFVGTLASLGMIISAPCYGATEITLDKVNGLFRGDTVIAGVSVQFDFRLTYTPGDGSIVTGSTNGFRVWTSNNGLTGTFSPITWDTFNISWKNIYAGGVFFAPDSSLGDLIDTIGFGGFALFTGGFYDGFDKPILYIETTPYQIGDTLCIDSSWYQPANSWLWSTTAGPFPPDWDGPHCFHVEQCCIGDKGNVDMRGLTNIADLTFLKAYLFHGGPAPPCTGAGDVDGVGGVNVADLTYLIDYLFRGGPAPPPCP